MRARPFIVLLLAVLAFPATLEAQSLGEVAVQEAQRRKRVTPGKHYTNDDLRPDSLPGAFVSEQRTESEVPTAEATLVEAEVAPADVLPDPDSDLPDGWSPPSPVALGEAGVPRGREKRDETYWRTQARQLRGRVGRIGENISALEGRLADLDAELLAGASPAVRRERDVTARSLESLRQDLRFVTEELERFEQRARSSNVPPAWIR